MKIKVATEVIEIEKVEVEISEDLRKKLRHKVERQNESQVVLHCRMHFDSSFTLVRIWPSTILLPKVGGPVAKLQHAINIPMYPTWLKVSPSPYLFTLIFEGLPKDCDVFDFIEHIPEEGGFICRDILRNASDVYYIDL